MRVLFAVILTLLSACSFTQGYKIDVELKGAENQKIYLGTYYGNQKLLVDSCFLDASGKGRLDGDEMLAHGLYLIILPEVTYFDIIVSDDQEFSVSNNISNITLNLFVSGSTENEAFVKFQKLTYNTHMAIQSLKDNDPKRDSLGNLVRQKRKEFISENKSTLFADLLYAMEEPDVPQEITLKGEEPAFQYYKQNYFSHIRFDDERMLRTPLVYNKINHFFLHLCEWQPDTIIKYSFWLCDQAKGNREFFYYVFNHLYHGLSVTGKFSNDEAFVSLVKKYLDSGQLWWADENILNGMRMQIKLLEPTLAGTPAPALNLLDSNMKPVNLSQMKSEWLLLLFWDPDCEHCSSFYNKLNSLASRPEYARITFVSVNTANDLSKWKTYLKEHPAPFIHTLSDPSKAAQLDAWNLFATPRIFVLDSQMKIVLKDPDPEYILLFLSNK